MTALVTSFFHRPTSTWTHVASDPASHTAVVIDPVLDFEPASGRIDTHAAHAVLDYLHDKQLSLVWILETHAHADHLSAAAWLRTRTGAPVAIGAGITIVEATFKPRLGLSDSFPANGSSFDRLLHTGERLPLGTLEVEVMATPGHTPDSVSYRIGDAVFIGDTLFSPACGSARCDFPGGDAATLYDSVQRLYQLPPETRVYLCHDYPPDGVAPRAQVSLAEERESNAHLAAHVTKEAFVELRMRRDTTLAVPRLLWPSLQVNIRAGHLPSPDINGQRFLQLPLDIGAWEVT
ncbi:MAG TPA: MBL fold metallo-hydrolase [Dyella sp.]|uniref:MBL fold metallo-hydrolase n=1 Tax=Dyella sp. TaxID=1869338 RepID=UPI002C5E985C|nr:MBL fold metallo-hydrolase [Dyella sp.]HTV87078.1 MBL fold metallo-hydrolase [Dyella sp.]